MLLIYWHSCHYATWKTRSITNSQHSPCDTCDGNPQRFNIHGWGFAGSNLGLKPKGNHYRPALLGRAHQAGSDVSSTSGPHTAGQRGRVAPSIHPHEAHRQRPRRPRSRHRGLVASNPVGPTSFLARGPTWHRVSPGDSRGQATRTRAPAPTEKVHIVFAHPDANELSTNDLDIPMCCLLCQLPIFNIEFGGRFDVFLWFFCTMFVAMFLVCSSFDLEVLFFSFGASREIICRYIQWEWRGFISHDSDTLH